MTLRLLATLVLATGAFAQEPTVLAVPLDDSAGLDQGASEAVVSFELAVLEYSDGRVLRFGTGAEAGDIYCSEELPYVGGSALRGDTSCFRAFVDNTPPWLPVPAQLLKLAEELGEAGRLDERAVSSEPLGSVHLDASDLRGVPLEATLKPPPTWCNMSSSAWGDNVCDDTSFPSQSPIFRCNPNHSIPPTTLTQSTSGKRKRSLSISTFCGSYGDVEHQYRNVFGNWKKARLITNIVDNTAYTVFYYGSSKRARRVLHKTVWPEIYKIRGFSAFYNPP